MVQEAVAFHENQRGDVYTSETTSALSTGGGKPGQGYPAIAFQESELRLTGKITEQKVVAFQQNQLGEVRCGDVAGTINTNSNASGRNTPMAAHRMAVRRLTPKECERLQGFPDDHTLIPWRGKPADQCPDGPRYKALGNSMAVPCMAWIGKRIAKAERERQGAA